MCNLERFPFMARVFYSFEYLTYMRILRLHVIKLSVVLLMLIFMMKLLFSTASKMIINSWDFFNYLDLFEIGSKPFRCLRLQTEIHC